MQIFTPLIHLSALALMAAISLPASAYTVYTNGSTFASALVSDPAPNTSQDFNTIVTDQSFRAANGSKSIGSLTFAETGSSTAGTSNGSPNQFDASPFEFSSDYADAGNTYVLLAVDTNYGVNLTFSAPVNAFGGNFTQVPGATIDTIRLTLLNASVPGSFALPATGFGFFGIIGAPGETFTGIAFSPNVDVSGRGIVGLDEVSIQFVPVPEPATSLVVGLAAVGALMGRRRRAATR